MKNRNWIFLLSLFWLMIVFAIVFWWGYLLKKLNYIITEAQLTKDYANFGNMLKWEGLTLIILFVILTTSLLVLYRRDLKHYQSLQRFFSTLTHELKTPLSSIQLHSEVMSEILQEKNEEKKLQDLFNKQQHAVKRLEDELNKVLALSRIEGKSQLTTKSFDLRRFLTVYYNKNKEIYPFLKFNPEQLTSCDIHADENALEIILNNLLQNTQNHNKDVEIAEFNVKIQENNIILKYQDHPQNIILSDYLEWTDLFYKSSQSKGSGIGLYLVNQLVNMMGGEFKIQNENKILSFIIQIPKGI